MTTLADMLQNPEYVKYAQFIDRSFSSNNVTYRCVTKDVVTDFLMDISGAPHFDKYGLYLIGRMNSAEPYPTMDVDLVFDQPIQEKQEMMDLMHTLRTKGDQRNIRIDVKHVDNITYLLDMYDDISKRDTKNFNQALRDASGVIYDISSVARTFSVRKGHRTFEYYTPRLISAAGSSAIDASAMDYVSNMELPLSSYIGYHCYEDVGRDVLLDASASAVEASIKTIDASNYVYEVLDISNAEEE